jgi:glutathione S-transferase
MLKILGRRSSINVRKVLWLCDELGLRFAHEPWGDAGLPLDSPAFLKLNPNGQVPVMQDGDFVLWESNTICRYLAGRAGRADLLPTEPHARARVEQWIDWAATDLNDAWRYPFMGVVRQSPAHADPALIEAGLARWNRLMTLLDSQLARTGAFVCGAGFTLADIVLGLAVNRWAMTPMAHPALPAVQAYVDRLAARPAFLAHGRNGLP